MKNILIIPVNYNSYNNLKAYLDSIAESMRQLETGSLAIDVVVADNSTQMENVERIGDGFRLFEVKNYNNKGYFGGAFAVYNTVEEIEKYDYVIFSNVDLRVDISFFKYLIEKELSSEIGWLAPAILSKQEERDMNPKIVRRYSKRTMQMLKLMYQFPIIKKIYMATMHKAKHINAVVNHDEREIYAGHGAMFIMTQTFIKKNNHLEYPVFLYGEEIFMGERVRLSGLKTLYVPTIVVYDDGHVSTSTIKKKTNHKYNVDALTYLIKEFYE